MTRTRLGPPPLGLPGPVVPAARASTAAPGVPAAPGHRVAPSLPADPASTAHTKVLLALLLPVGPAAVAALRFVLPYRTIDSDTAIAQHVAAHPAAESAVVWLGLVASLVLVPSVLAVGRVARAGAPRLVAAALLLLVPGYLCLPWLLASDAAVLFAVRHELPTPVAAAGYSSLHPTVMVAGGIFVLGHVVGTILLGLALWRGDAVPRAAAFAVVVAQPLHFVAAVVLGSHALDLAAWGLNALGFAAVSWAMLRMSDVEWAGSSPVAVLEDGAR